MVDSNYTKAMEMASVALVFGIGAPSKLSGTL